MKILGMEIFVVGSILAVSLCCFAFLATAQITDPSEVAALLAIKSSLIDPMKHLKNWDKGDPCILNWTGVLCFNTSGTDGYAHVREIHLLAMNLSGSLAPELGKLSHVEVLDFMWNDITGSLPKEIGNIASLKLLLLNGNKLSGSLPDEIGYLANLNRLQVDENNISGPIPKSFASLSRLRHLHLNNNSISGQIPRELSNVSSLLHLLLDSNNLSGYLPPDLSDLPDLRILQLDNNHFVEIPASYANFPKLVKLSLRNCSLQGPVPDLSRIPKLSYLDLSRNQLVGSIPSNKLSDNVTTINLSDNKLNGSIPGNFSNLPNLQKLDLQNNSFSNILGVLNPPANVTVRLQGNPICNSADIENIDQFCGSGARGDETHGSSTNSTIICPIQACPVDNFFEYVPASPVPCFCALPLIIGYRLKSPSFSYFAPYKDEFKMYLTSSLNLDLYQLYIDPYIWEKGPRLRMAFKLFPKFDNKSSMFNMSEIQRIGNIFTTWAFPPNDFFGPYELLSFTLTGPYLNVLVSNGRRGGISKGILAAIVLVAGSCTITISGIFVVLMIRRKSRRFRKMSAKHPSSKISLKIDEVKCFTLKEMQLATENFNNLTLVGQGGYGNVYKGILADRTIVAIKRAQQGSLQGEKEFLTEIELLSRLHHRNLVSLVGYCDEEGEQMLIYEFMPNGTLRDWLSGKLKGNLSFSTRLHIALDSAKGILYLHTEANPPIFHRDIKASNILLDPNLTAKVADFGLSRLAPVPDDEGTLPGHVSTIVKGTPGYLDPEYFLTHNLTDKSDVYSLGVVFLELLTGMQPISHGKNIVREVNVAQQSGIMFAIIDGSMGSYPSECIERFVALALRCCQDEPQARPSMLDIVRELENILQMMPPCNSVHSESTATCSVNPASPSSSAYTSRNPYVSSDISGSDLISGVYPTITPR